MQKNPHLQLALGLAVAATVLAGGACGSDEYGALPGLPAYGEGGSGGAGAGDAGSSPTGTGASSAATGSGTLGAACAGDSDCRTGLFCLTAASQLLDGGGPASGVCTADCSVDPGVCEVIADGALCLGLSFRAFCFEPCSVGSPGGPTKCHGRLEMACSSVPAPLGKLCESDADCGAGFCAENVSGSYSCFAFLDACLPQCNAPDDCPSGTTCDMGSALFGFGMGLCRATPRAGSGTGAACDPNAAVSGCRGLCLPLDDTTAMCADGCTLGVGDSCGFGGDSQDPAEAACLFAFSNTSDLGDAAACAALCDCNDECPQPELVCVPLGADGTAYYGRMGYCDLPLDGAASDGMPCGTAGAGS